MSCRDMTQNPRQIIWSWMSMIIKSAGGCICYQLSRNSITSLMLPLFICYCYITSSGLYRAARPDMFLIYRICTSHYFTFARKCLVNVLDYIRACIVKHMVPPKTFNMYTCNTLHAFFACIIHPICKHQAFHLSNAFLPVYLGRICCLMHTGTYIMAFFQPKIVYWNEFLVPHIFTFDRAPTKVSFSDWNTRWLISFSFYTPNCVPLQRRCRCKFLGRSSAKDMDTRTHPSHTCAVTVWLPLPKFHASPEGLYTAQSVLLGVGCWALG